MSYPGTMTVAIAEAVIQGRSVSWLYYEDLILFEKEK